MLLDLYPRVHRRYTSLTILGLILDGYGTWLLKQGYSPERARKHVQAAPLLVRGLQQRGVQALTSLTRARLRACAPADSQEDPDLAVLVRQLGRYCESELSLYPSPALTRVEQRVAAYRSYLQQVRGFAPSTLTHHGRTAGEFLAHMDYEMYPARLTALERRDLHTFLCAVGPRQSRASHAGQAPDMLDQWLAWAARSRLAPFVKLARTIRKHAAGILAYLDTKMTNGPVEGFNNKLRVIARRAYGFHSHGALISMLFLCCGGIELAPTHTRL